MEQRELTFLAGVRACIPTVLGYMGIGIAAGVVAAASHLSLLENLLLSTLVYAGASQFIICGMLLLSSPVSAIMLTTFLINSRHILMSMATAPSFKNASMLNNIGIASLLTDESFAVAMNQIGNKRLINVPWMHGLNVTAYFTWIVSCMIGAAIGQFLPNPEQLGLDFALTAMFIGLLYLQLISDKGKKLTHGLLVISVVAVLVFFFMRFFSSELAILCATLLGCLIGVITSKWQSVHTHSSS